jgi:hypothetical protein
MQNRLVILTALTLLLLIVTIPLSTAALDSSEAKQAWFNASEASRDAQKAHREANIDWASEKTPENNQRVIDTGKTALRAALDEAEAWLRWKEAEVNEDPRIPADLKDTITQDVQVNLGKIDELRVEVDAIDTRVKLGVVFLKMVGSYVELLTDVARNTGLVWVQLMTGHADTIEGFEADLRDAAVGIPNNGDIITKLDEARDELATARTNINHAQSEYLQVRLTGTPLVKFSNGNNFLRIARGNLLSAHGYLNQAYMELLQRGG